MYKSEFSLNSILWNDGHDGRGVGFGSSLPVTEYALQE